MNRADVDRIYNGIKGEGLNGTGDFRHSNTGNPIAPINFDEPIDYNLDQPTIGALKNIVNSMSDDREWLDEDSGMTRPHVDGLPDRARVPFYGEHDLPDDDYTAELDEYLYNHPDEKSLFNYFGEQGLAGWLINQPKLSSPYQQDMFAEGMNILEAYNRDQRKRAEYANFLQDMAKSSDKGFYLGQRLREKERPRSRQRNITGSAK